MFRNASSLLKATCGAFIVMALTQSCQKSVDQQATTSAPVSEAHIAELKQTIAGLSGTNVSNVSYDPVDQSFGVTGDARMTLDDAEAYFKSKQVHLGTQSTEQMMYSYLIDQTKVRNIVIAVDASVPSDWITILDQALANWNASGSGVHITRSSTVVAAAVTSGTTAGVTGAVSANANGRKKTQTTTTTTSGSTGSTGTTSGGTTTTTTTSPNIVVRTFNNSATSTIAQAYYPDSYGNPGFEIDINLYYTYLSSSYKVFALTHELGHNLGLTHTDQTFGTLVPGTPTVDANSVMNSVCLSWAGFTNYDLVAIRTLYPY